MGDWSYWTPAAVGTPGHKSHQCLAQVAQVELDRVESINLRPIDSHCVVRPGHLEWVRRRRPNEQCPERPHGTPTAWPRRRLCRICNSTDATGRFYLSWSQLVGTFSHNCELHPLTVVCARFDCDTRATWRREMLSTRSIFLQIAQSNFLIQGLKKIFCVGHWEVIYIFQSCKYIIFKDYFSRDYRNTFYPLINFCCRNNVIICLHLADNKAGVHWTSFVFWTQ